MNTAVREPYEGETFSEPEEAWTISKVQTVKNPAIETILRPQCLHEENIGIDRTARIEQPSAQITSEPVESPTINDVESLKGAAETLFRPLLLSLWIIGVFGTKFQGTGKIKWWGRLVFLLVHVRCAITVANNVILWSKASSKGVMLVSGIEVGMAAVTLFSYHHFRTNGWRAMEILEKESQLIATDKKILRTLKQRTVWLTAFSWCHCLVLLAFMLWYISTVQLQTYYDRYLFGLKVSTTGWHKTVALIFLMFDWLTFTCFVPGPVFFFMSYYSLVALYLASEISIIGDMANQEMTQIDQSTSQFVVTKLSTTYFNVCNNIKEFNDIFTSAIFIWFVFYILLVTTVSYQVVLSIASSQKAEDFVGYVPTALFGCVAILGSSLAAEKIFLKSKGLLTGMCQDFLVKIEPKPELVRIFQLLIDKIINDPPVLTGWGSFVINRRFVLTTFSIVMTFIFLLLQMEKDY